jgi:hypothetical protein
MSHSPRLARAMQRRSRGGSSRAPPATGATARRGPGREPHTVVLPTASFASRACSSPARAAGPGSPAARRSRARLRATSAAAPSWSTPSRAPAPTLQPTRSASWEPASPGRAWHSTKSGAPRRPTWPNSPAAPATRPRDSPAALDRAHFETRGVPTNPDEILVTNGAQQAIDLVGAPGRPRRGRRSRGPHLPGRDRRLLARGRLVCLCRWTGGRRHAGPERGPSRRRRPSSTWSRASTTPPAA